ncbi:MAG: hypothetical protein H7263_11590 [Candidatus Sericytochromatia bacterium]|nr:hypothetical protein [Candidatus Sericytochromatia bacterium]
MVINDDKLLFHCNTCELYFYDSVEQFATCPDCNKSVAPFRNLLKRHREQCPTCEKIFEVAKKSPYENAHFLNCDSCMTVLKIDYSDSVLQKHINRVVSDTYLGDSQIRDYWDEVEYHLNDCLCGGQFNHKNCKKCPYCLSDIDSISPEYMVINNYRQKVSVPLISKHIWKSSEAHHNKNILDEDSHHPVLRSLINYMKTIKYFQEHYYERKKIWAESIEELKSYARVENLISHYFFAENESLLDNYFIFSFELFPDNYHLVALPKIKDHINQNLMDDKNLTYSYLLQGKTGEIDIHQI